MLLAQESEASRVCQCDGEKERWQRAAEPGWRPDHPNSARRVRQRLREPSSFSGVALLGRNNPQGSVQLERQYRLSGHANAAALREYLRERSTTGARAGSDWGALSSSRDCADVGPDRGALVLIRFPESDAETHLAAIGARAFLVCPCAPHT